MKRISSLLLIALAGALIMFSNEIEAQPEVGPGEAQGVRAIIDAIRAGDASRMASLRTLPDDAIPELLKFIDDGDSQVRHGVTLALGGKKDKRVIPALLERLEDKDRNVRAVAIGAFSRMPTNLLQRRESRATLALLGRFASRWDEGSYKAVLLLGELGGEAERQVLRGILGEAELAAKAPPDGTKNVLAPRLQLACLKALVRLNDAEAIRSVLALLESPEVSSRTVGIECVDFAGRRELAHELVPLLDDKRDALNIAPSGAEYYLRVRDLAVNAIVKLWEVRPPFEIQRGLRYTDEQIGELRILVGRKQ